MIPMTDSHIRLLFALICGFVVGNTCTIGSPNKTILNPIEIPERRVHVHEIRSYS